MKCDWCIPLADSLFLTSENKEPWYVDKENWGRRRHYSEQCISSLHYLYNNPINTITVI